MQLCQHSPVQNEDFLYFSPDRHIYMVRFLMLNTYNFLTDFYLIRGDQRSWFKARCTRDVG